MSTGDNFHHVGAVDGLLSHDKRPNKSKSFSTPKTNTGLESRSKFYEELPLTTTNNLSNNDYRQKTRDEHLHILMHKRRDEYTVKKKINVFIGSWNVNGKNATESLHDWLLSEAVTPDIYFIGFQELDLSNQAYVFSESSREHEWIEKVKQTLNTSHNYKLVRHVRLIGMMLLCFASSKQSKRIKRVMHNSVGTGILGVMGNKGGVAIRLEIMNSVICVVNSHLAAHTENTRRRNQDFHDIKSKLKFDLPDSKDDIFGADILVWLGDLNYRIDGLQCSVIKNWANEKKFDALKRYDQLLNEMERNTVFSEFCEGDISFTPTYKYDPGTDNWDTSEKSRAPAWCDRILWWEKDNKKGLMKNNEAATKSCVRQLNYKPHSSLRLSDHKPISSLFEFDVNKIDEVKYKKILEEEMRRLDKMENDHLPSAKISSHMVEFGDVKFSEAVHRSISITNTGTNPCTFEFATKPDINAKCKPWLTINHSSTVLMPQESMDIDMEIYINLTTVADLNSGKDTLEDILVLHLHNGKDFFVTINGSYMASCFGLSLPILCRMQRPIRSYSLDEIQALHTNEFSNNEGGQSIPKELWKLIDHLYVLSKEEEDLFQVPGLHDEEQNIREFLDTQPVTSQEPLPGTTHSVGETLLMFLASLPQPVIPNRYFQQCVNALQQDDLKSALSEVIDGLPRVNRLVLEYLLIFLRELPQYPSNGLTPRLIAEIFSSSLLPVPSALTSLPMARNAKRKSTDFIYNCIVLDQ